MRILSILIVLGIINSAFAIENRSLSLFRHGRDAAGVIIYDRIEIFPDLSVVWRAASKGSNCSSEAGTFIGKLNQENFEKVYKLAESVEADKGILKEDKRKRDSREVSISMTIEGQGKIRGVNINEYTDSVSALDEALSFVKSELTPESGVRMQVEKTKSGAKVQFIHLGQKPFRLLVPKAASEAFYLQNKSPVKFKATPKTRNVMLSPTKKSVSYEISATLDKADKHYLFYSGAALAHHADVAANSKLPKAQEVALCSEF